MRVGVRVRVHFPCLHNTDDVHEQQMHLQTNLENADEGQAGRAGWTVGASTFGCFTMSKCNGEKAKLCHRSKREQKQQNK